MTMRFAILFAAGLLQASMCLAQEQPSLREQQHHRPHLLLPPAAILPQAASPTHAPPRSVVQQPRTTDANALVNAADLELARVAEYAGRTFWVKNSFITFDTNWLEAYAGAQQSRVLLHFIKDAAQYNGAAVDAVTRRKLDIIKLAAAMPPPDRADGLEELAALTARLDSAYSTLTVPYQGRVLTREEAAALARNSRDPAELKALWEAVRANLPPMRADYARTVELANEGARALGYKDVGEMWRSAYDMPPEAFADLIDALWAQLEPLHKNFMCYVRGLVSDTFGSAEQPRTGPIRQHLLATRWENIAGNANEETTSYDVTKLLQQKDYSVVKMVKTAESFYTSLGLAPLPETFWQRSMFTRPRDREVGCWPTSWHLDSKDDVRLAACLRVNADDFRMSHHELGHAFYYRAYKDQPYLFQGGANDGFHEAVGDFIGLSAQTPTYLHQIGLLDAVPGPESDIPFLFKMLDWHAGALSIHLAMEKWRWDVFAGKVAPEAYNDAWWQRQRQYRGMVPPGPRPADAFDASGVWHITGHIPVIRYFISEIYQFQFHRAACRIAGWTGPLHRCSIYGNKEVGARLQAMLALGASKPWPEALAAFTGERELDASAMLEYFAPLDRWLTEKNKGEQCGW
jgi:peptidyl-dipeptidase A